MTQLFSNNGDTTLAAILSDAATSASLTDGAKFAAPTGTEYELLTLLTEGGAVEIVRMTARTGNTATITRAQEGTTAQAFAAGTRVFGGITKATLESFVRRTDAPVQIGASASAKSAEDIALGSGATANSASATPSNIAIGTSASALNVYSVALGREASANGYMDIAIGYQSDATNTQSIAVGYSAEASGYQAIALGSAPVTAATADFAMALGIDAVASEEYATALGYGAAASGMFSVAAGLGIAEREFVFNVGAIHAGIRAALAENAYAMSLGGTAAWVGISAAVNLKTAATITCPLPAGVTFYPDEVGLIVEAADGVTGQPDVSFGITGSNAKLLAVVTTTGLTAAKKRQRFQTLLSADGETSLTFTVDVAATGTTLTARAYWRGFAVQDAVA